MCLHRTETSTFLNPYHKLTSRKKKDRDFKLSFRTNNMAVNRMVQECNIDGITLNDTEKLSTLWWHRVIAGLLRSLWIFLILKDGAVKDLFSIFAHPKWQTAHQTYSLDLRTKVKEPPQPQLQLTADKIHCIHALDWVLPCQGQHRSSCTVQGYGSGVLCCVLKSWYSVQRNWAGTQLYSHKGEDSSKRAPKVNTSS